MTIELLKKYKIKAKKSLGQNFLIDDDSLQNIVDYSEIEGKNILEVGPGYGALTERLLLKKPKSLRLVELDQEMIDILRDRIASDDLKTGSVDFEIINEDILTHTPTFNSLHTKDGRFQYSVIANIPYYITSPILRHFLYEVPEKPEKMIILMQKDVADKIIQGQNGAKKLRSSVLSLFISKKCHVEEVCFVGKHCFVPAPKVDSSVLCFQCHEDYNDTDDEELLTLIKAGFAEPRKKLVKNLIKTGHNCEKLLTIFNKLGFSENIRAENLSINERCKLVEEL